MTRGATKRRDDETTRKDAVGSRAPVENSEEVAEVEGFEEAGEVFVVEVLDDDLAHFALAVGEGAGGFLKTLPHVRSPAKERRFSESSFIRAAISSCGSGERRSVTDTATNPASPGQAR